ncbi:acyl-CoA dehydrogenase family protein [Raineyella sp. W15-4]|uniref:acyl-CoA dehydrogenase family protein n=1 Tax=Raineyella sp. W15-4 TaxID=3081651 RepID=UPI002954E9EB|nr:acyl-CoA dehydrogenase family protein [Raineyella sp. W15-4]WOQ18049.1 acyl-CoA dehydrogenase family protein [Raineyella sp. W15-4]
MPFFEPEQDDYREIVRDFVDREVMPHYARWEAAGQVDPAVWRAAAQRGLLGLEVGPEHGGMGLRDWRFRLVVIEELGFAGAAALNTGFAAHDDLVLPAIQGHGSEELRRRWLPRMATGASIGAIALTEPGAGSDLRAIRTRAVAAGDDWVLDGQKAFVSNGSLAEVLVVAASTDGGKSLTLFALDGDTPGIDRGHHLDKLGLRAQDTVEVFLTDCRVPAGNVLGEVGDGLAILRRLLPRQRLAQAAISWAEAAGALRWTENHVFARRAFGQRIGDFQNTRFTLAEIETGLDVTRSYLERCVDRLDDGTLSPVEAAKAKWWAGEQAVAAVSGLLQLFGGYGFMEEYPIARAFRDSRVQTIYAGATEVMKDLIGRDIARRHH